MTDSASSGGWISGTVILGILLLFLFIVVIVIAYNSNSQIKNLTASQGSRDDELKRFYSDAVSLIKKENQALQAQINELKTQLEAKDKAHKKLLKQIIGQIQNDYEEKFQECEEKFSDYEERFYEIDTLISNYTGNETNTQKDKPAPPRQKQKVARPPKVLPTRNNIKQRQKSPAQPQRKATFVMPSDDSEDDMSDSEIAAADIRRGKNSSNLLDF